MRGICEVFEFVVVERRRKCPSGDRPKTDVLFSNKVGGPQSTMAIRPTVVPIRILIRMTVVPIRILIHMTAIISASS